MSSSEPNLSESFDPLAETLRFLRPSGTFYSCAELEPPWGIELPAFPGSMMFHVVTEGRCWLDVPGGDSFWLETGSLALVTRGEGHSVRAAPTARTTPLFDLRAEKLSERCERLRHGGDGLASERATLGEASPSCRALCGVVRFEHASAAKFVSALPAILTVCPGDDDESSWLTSTIRFVAREASALRPGAEAVITRLADILVVQAIRSWLASERTDQRGFLAALADPQLGRAIALMHGRPEQEWEVGTLAREVGMSRSAFASRFCDVVGQPAKTYLTEYRLRVAHDELRRTTEPVSAIAGRFGYRSEAAFTRAFRRLFEATPSEIRRASRDTP